METKSIRVGKRELRGGRHVGYDVLGSAANTFMMRLNKLRRFLFTRGKKIWNEQSY